MQFQSDEQRYRILAKLSLISLYILLAFDLVVILLGYFLAQTNNAYSTGGKTLKDIIFVVAVADLIAIFLIRKFMLGKATKDQTPASASEEILFYKKLLNITLVIAIMCSAISTYGLILVILGEKFEILLLFVAISLLGYQFFRLRPRDFKDDTGE